MKSIKHVCRSALTAVLIMVISLSACIQQQKDVEGTKFISKAVRFDEDCNLAEGDRLLVEFKLPKGFNQSKHEEEGMCEYRFSYSDGSIFYISTDVWFGSQVNLENRYLADQETYHKESLIDTIQVGGIDSVGNRWKEVVLGKVTYGFRGADIRREKLFSISSQSISYK